MSGLHDGARDSTGRADVYLHIGLAKTGTSHIQDVLWHSRERLSATGVLVPGKTRRFQTLAVWDLMGRRLRGAEQPEVAGSWRALVDAAAAWSGSSVMVSEEFLANARPSQVRRAVRAFAPARVHVVVTARDLSKVVGSAWQQELAKGHTWPWGEFVAAVRDPEHGPPTAGVAFWLRHDLLRVLDAWEASVPRERIHLVTVPPAGARPYALVERFAAATRLDPAALVHEQPVSNQSIGIAEAEVLRRLNLGLGGRLNEQQYLRAVGQGVKSAFRDRRTSRRIDLPAGELGWLTDRARSTVLELRSRGYEVTGDLEDLVPAARDHGATPTDDLDDSELAEAALAALVTLTEKYADLWWRTRRRERRVDAAVSQRIASLVRARGYRVRVAALDVADRNRWASRAVNAYLRRSSRSSS